MKQTETTEDLLSRARAGDRESLDRLIRDHAALVYGIALRQAHGDTAMAADVAQAVFIVLARRVATIRNARALPSWLHQTTRYAAKEAHRAATRRAHHERRAARAEQTIMDPSATEHADPKLAMLDEAIASLRQSDREVVMRRYLQGREVREIAAELGVGEEAARKRLSRAVDRLREFYERRGVVMNADAVTAVLVAASTSVTLPAAVLEACASAAAGGATAGNAGAVAKGVLYSIGAAKAKVAAGIAAAALVVTVGVIGVASLASAPRARRVVIEPPTPPSPTTGPAMTKDEALMELTQAYALANGQVIRVIRPPFPWARAAWADAEYPYARGSQNIRSLGFRSTPLGLDSWFMSYAHLDMRTILESGIRVPWYRVEGLDRVTLPPMRADLVVRVDATYEQKLQSLVDLVAEQTGKRFRVAKAQTTRPCITLKGQTRTPPESRDGFPTLVLTQAPLDDAALKAWFGGRRAKGSTHRFQFQPATELLGAPFFIDGTEGDAMEINVSLVLIAADAHLQPTDPEHETKLRKILDNIENQIGGAWRIERRTLDVFRIELAAP